MELIEGERSEEDLRLRVTSRQKISQCKPVILVCLTILFTLENEYTIFADIGILATRVVRSHLKLLYLNS